MEQENARNWAAEFEGKPASEIADVPPPGLSGSELVRWKLAQQAAKRAASAAMAEPSAGTALVADAVDPDERRRIERDAAYENLRERIARAKADLETPVDRRKFPDEVRLPHQPLSRPAGDAAQLLEHQLASGAALMDYIAHFVARPDTHPDVCMSFLEKMSSLLSANAQVGKVIGRLRGNISETRQTITVEKKQTGGGVGEGVLES